MGAGHPTMALQGFEQPGPRPLTCYGCGQPGHRRGDSSCRAGPKDVWQGTPDQFKVLIKRRGAEFPKGGKGKGKGGKGWKTEGLEQGAVDKLLVGIFVGCDGEGGETYLLSFS